MRVMIVLCALAAPSFADTLAPAKADDTTAPAKEEPAEPRGKNKRMALEAAKGGGKPKEGKGKPKAEGEAAKASE